MKMFLDSEERVSTEDCLSVGENRAMHFPKDEGQETYIGDYAPTEKKPLFVR